MILILGGIFELRPYGPRFTVNQQLTKKSGVIFPDGRVLASDTAGHADLAHAGGKGYGPSDYKTDAETLEPLINAGGVRLGNDFKENYSYAEFSTEQGALLTLKALDGLVFQGHIIAEIVKNNGAHIKSFEGNYQKVSSAIKSYYGI